MNEYQPKPGDVILMESEEVGLYHKLKNWLLGSKCALPLNSGVFGSTILNPRRFPSWEKAVQQINCSDDFIFITI